MPAVLASCLLPAAGCGNREHIAAEVVGGTLLGAQSPGQEIQQIYYLGVFDPQEQVPPTIYRVRVHGQASAISLMRFGSGWVPAPLIDTLTSRAGFDAAADRPNLTPAQAEESQLPSLKTGRRLMMFGPEGFREAPKDHRLVIVMGTNPEAFFNAIDTSLEAISDVRREQSDSAVARKLAQAMSQIQSERKRLDDLKKDVAVDLKDQTSAAPTSQPTGGTSR